MWIYRSDCIYIDAIAIAFTANSKNVLQKSISCFLTRVQFFCALFSHRVFIHVCVCVVLVRKTINSKAIFLDCIFGEPKTIILASEINYHKMACNNLIQLRKFISGHMSKLDITSHAWHRIIMSTSSHLHSHSHSRFRSVKVWCNFSTKHM